MAVETNAEETWVDLSNFDKKKATTKKRKITNNNNNVEKKGDAAAGAAAGGDNKKKQQQQPKRKRKKITDSKLPTLGGDEEALKLLLSGEMEKKGGKNKTAAAAVTAGLPDGIVAVSNVDMNHTVASFMKTGVPKWKKQLDNYSAHQCPVILVLCGNALRSCNLNTEAKSFKTEDCRSVKLFGKHLKLKDQIEKLKGKIVHFAVGSPARVLKLLDEGHMSIESTKFIAIDWNWRDVKLKRMVDQADIREPLMKLFERHIIPKFTENKRPKIGLF